MSMDENVVIGTDLLPEDEKRVDGEIDISQLSLEDQQLAMLMIEKFLKGDEVQ